MPFFCRSFIRSKQCNFDILALIMFIPTLLTGIMAWKTADVDERFSDSYWVSVLIIVQIEVNKRKKPLTKLSCRCFNPENTLSFQK